MRHCKKIDNWGKGYDIDSIVSEWLRRWDYCPSKIKGKYFQEIEDKIICLYKKGYSIREIAAKYGIGQTSVYNCLVKRGVQARNLSFSLCFINKKLYKDDIIFLYKEGLSTYELSDFYGVDSGTIGRWLRGWGIPRSNVYRYQVSKPEKTIYNYVNKIYGGGFQMIGGQ